MQYRLRVSVIVYIVNVVVVIGVVVVVVVVVALIFLLVFFTYLIAKAHTFFKRSLIACN